ncbi:MAG TPA: cupredoxin domain-containing protein [Candidatus Saccharimonadales bacterium]|jgi:plastocyanin|nr:cupredoxin domain-containing protein [Candidatus Saccharimonadales bacterium]
MNKKTMIGIIVVASVIILGAWAYAATRPASESSINTPEKSDTTDTSSPETTGTKAPSESSPVATITYTDDGFSPSTTTVKKGSTITVTNNSTVNVMLSSADHPTHVEQPELNMSTLKPGESGTITLTKVGTWGFHDHIDESMTGTIVVTE